jgi:dihydroorotate dehydrogenase
MLAKLWSWTDPYPLLRPIMFRLEPERAHALTIQLLQRGWGPQEAMRDDPVLGTTVWGKHFSNPVGLAAGFDKQAEAIDASFALGFGFSELGGVTRRAQPGNPQPRLFRVPQAKAIINRFGFNSIGVDAFAARLRLWRDNPHRTQRPLGVNLGKNKDSTEEAADFIALMTQLAPLTDFVTINISSPNTPGLRNLQRRDALDQLLGQLQTARQTLTPNLLMLLKIAPDLDEAAQHDIADLCLRHGVAGIIVSNTTTTRSSNIPDDLAQETGGLSGQPLQQLSTHVLRAIYRLTDGKIPLIGCGGIASGEDAYRKIRAGASLVQLYTALIYEGPLVVRRIKRELAAHLKRDGFASVQEAVGTAAAR